MYNHSISPNSFNSHIDPNLTQPTSIVPNNLFRQSYLGSYSTNMPAPSAVLSSQHANPSGQAMPLDSYDAYQADGSRRQLFNMHRIDQNMPLEAGVVSEVNDVNFREKVLNSAVPVIVKFEAQWCGPCRAMSPLLKQLAIDYAAHLRFAHIDVDISQDTANAFDVQTLPTMILFEHGKEVRRTQGAQTPASLTAFIKNYPAA